MTYESEDSAITAFNDATFNTGFKNFLDTFTELDLLKAMGGFSEMRPGLSFRKSEFRENVVKQFKILAGTYTLMINPADRCVLLVVVLQERHLLIQTGTRLRL